MSTANTSTLDNIIFFDIKNRQPRSSSRRIIRDSMKTGVWISVPTNGASLTRHRSSSQLRNSVTVCRFTCLGRCGERELSMAVRTMCGRYRRYCTWVSATNSAVVAIVTILLPTHATKNWMAPLLEWNQTSLLKDSNSVYSNTK